MCGFVGWFRAPGAPLELPVLRRMLAAIRHRGPDDEGLHALSFLHGCSRPVREGEETLTGFDAGLGFARLSIQDLTAAGHQPMMSADGGAVLVFNGEIYNAPALREVLVAGGAVFRGHSDTEVILRLYERHGWDGMLARVEGMFAIAIADLRERCLRVARDPFGIKPLYYHEPNGGGGGVLLASEMKAFLAHPGFEAVVEGAHLAEQLMFRHTAWDRTLLRGVRQLPPGHELEWKPGGPVKVTRYWALPPAEPVEDARHPQEVREALRAAVRGQLLSDVPLGTQLSGGIDSSLVTLDAARQSPGVLNTFSIVFEDPRVSEDAWMDQAARKAGVHSHRYLFSPGQFAADFERVTWHLDGPPGNPNTLAIDLLAREARRHVKVLLTGEGCDELFAGYNRFYYAAQQEHRPWVFRAGGALCRLTGQGGRLWRLFGQAARPLEHQWVTGSAYGAADLMGLLLPGVGVEQALEARLDHLAGIPGKGIFRQVRYEAETYLPDLLLRQDKMTMAHGVECRVPFLDMQVARAARSLPAHWLAAPLVGPNARMRGTKRLIKEIAAAEFGPAFAYRRKRGFDVPLAEFFQQPVLRQKVREAWLPAMLERGLLNGKALRGLWETLEKGPAGAGPGMLKSAAEAFWVALGLEVWAGQFLDGKGREKIGKDEFF